ncbi:winged helix-turn-helix transcriptional regulator [Microbacterium karelineae]|uniref:winged helix-turn-helix transcriptional regulator n=1 Tax=Microbacterium karelineae TaxID=2654283 RepID=UPI0012EA8C5B|nr:helix-turn-helix domain-containing protein [Microbacterium karelineae]
MSTPNGEVEPAQPSVELVADVFARDCPSRAAFDDVTSKWGSLAMLALAEGTYRFNALRRRVDGISDKMLSQTLNTLERGGFVVREVVDVIPARVEYELTDLGRDVAARLRSLADLLEATVAGEGAATPSEAPAGPTS